LGLGGQVYPPLSSIRLTQEQLLDLAISVYNLAGVSSLLGAINFIATILICEQQAFLCISAHYRMVSLVTAFLLLLSLPGFGRCYLLCYNRTEFQYLLSLILSAAGDPILYQHSISVSATLRFNILIYQVLVLISHVVSS